MCSRPAALLMAAAVLVVAAALVPPALAQDGGWRTGRVTYFGAPASVAAAYDPKRGEGSFGILEYGSCGYTNAGGRLAFPREQAAAAADASADFPGSCGRCYEVRCRTGPVLDNAGQPIKVVGGFYEGDRFRPYLPAINPNVTDTKGRPFPGNPEEASGGQVTSCFDQGRTVRLRITDSCPCNQVLPAGAPGVAPGGETRTQQWCCKASGLQHFDISYDAFEQLAHPVFGVAMVEWRPVDCDTGALLQFDPGYIDRSTIYSGAPRPGWGWQPYSASAFELSVPSAPSPAGTPSTCLVLSPGGGLQFKCRECSRQGYQPFAGASSIGFWVRRNGGGNSSDAGGNGTAVPDLKLILQKAETKNFCGKEPATGQLAPAKAAAGGWARFEVPAAAFDCPGGGIQLSDATQFEFQNAGERDAPVCVAEIKINR